MKRKPATGLLRWVSSSSLFGLESFQLPFVSLICLPAGLMDRRASVEDNNDSHSECSSWSHELLRIYVLQCHLVCNATGGMKRALGRVSNRQVDFLCGRRMYPSF